MTAGNEIALLLEEKLVLLEKICSCAEKLSVMKFEDQTSEYQSLLDSRQQYMTTITKLDIVIGNHQGDTAFQTTNARIREVIARIIQIDKGNKERLFEESLTIRQKVNNIRQGKKGTASYLNFGQISAAGAYTDSRK